MSETQAQAPLPHDGWKSRKVIMGAATMACIIAGCAFALAFDKANFDQVASLVKWAVPGVLIPTMGAMGLDKLAEAKRG